MNEFKDSMPQDNQRALRVIQGVNLGYEEVLRELGDSGQLTVETSAVIYRLMADLNDKIESGYLLE